MSHKMRLHLILCSMISAPKKVCICQFDTEICNIMLYIHFLNCDQFEALKAKLCSKVFYLCINYIIVTVFLSFSAWKIVTQHIR